MTGKVIDSSGRIVTYELHLVTGKHGKRNSTDFLSMELILFAAGQRERESLPFSPEFSDANFQMDFSIVWFQFY